MVYEVERKNSQTTTLYNVKYDSNGPHSAVWKNAFLDTICYIYCLFSLYRKIGGNLTMEQISAITD